MAIGCSSREARFDCLILFANLASVSLIVRRILQIASWFENYILSHTPFVLLFVLRLFAGSSRFRNDMQMQWASKATLVFQGVTLRNSGRLVGRCGTLRAAHLSAKDLYPVRPRLLLSVSESLSTPTESELRYRIRKSAQLQSPFLASCQDVGTRFILLVW